MPTSFGQVIPVTGPNIGFAGNISRQGERVVVARQLLSSTASNLNFGAPAVIIPDSTGGTHQSVTDFVNASAANASLVAAQFNGFAVRNVKTQLSFISLEALTPVAGSYAPGEMSEVIERGSVTVVLANGTPVTQGQVYTRVGLNPNISAGTVGDIEAGPIAATDAPSTTGTASSGSTALTVASGANISKGALVSGAGIAAGTVVTAVSGTSVTLSAPTTAALSSTAVSFSNLVALPSVVFRTGYVDANNVVEITLKTRNAA